MKRLCTVAGCTAPFLAKGMCNKHYYEIWRANHPETMKRTRAKYRARSVEQRKAYRLAHREKYPEKYVAKEARRYAANPEKQRNRWRAWCKANPAKATAMVARRYAAKIKATPAWANEFFIEEMYELARLRTKLTGFKWHVDHIVPLKSNLVCGFHVEHNLQVIPAVENFLKNNKWWPDMPSKGP